MDKDECTTSSTKTTIKDRLLKLRKKGVIFLLLVVPYLVGLVWHGLHPFVSVFTGDDHPRGIYTDENSAEPNYFRVSHSKFKRREQLIPAKYRDQPLPSLCRAVRAVTSADAFTYGLDQDSNSFLQCRSINQTVDILQFTPTEGPITERSEALVFVVPASSDWMQSHLHVALLSFLAELLQPRFNWLSKTFYVVSPRIRDGLVLNVTQTTNLFLEAYLGSSKDGDTNSNDSTLLPNLVGKGPLVLPKGIYPTALLRQIIVWDQEIVEKETKGLKLPTVRILPQGPRGLLPNMDLVSVVRAALQRTLSSNVYYGIHPFQERQQKLGESFDSICTMFLGKPCPQRHMRALLNLFWFEHTMRGHDFTSPHGVALERGIDALTIQLVVRPFVPSDTKMRNAASKVPAAMEICLRALSNLHERLHHSTSLYLLLSMDHFVKHEEYLVPNLLLLIPLIVRAVTLFLIDLEEFDWSAVGLVTERTVLSIFFISLALDLVDFIDAHSWWIFADSLSARHSVVGLVYLYLTWQFMFGKRPRSAQSRQSIQFFACLWGLYTHLAIAFGHVSLAFPSAVLWTPLLAFPFYSDGPHELAASTATVQKLRQGIQLLLSCLVFLCLVPFVWFVPSVIPSYTPYVCYAYIPLHLIVSHLLLS
jgi:glycosylphosphatidylinositol transamidase